MPGFGRKRDLDLMNYNEPPQWEGERGEEEGSGRRKGGKGGRIGKGEKGRQR